MTAARGKNIEERFSSKRIQANYKCERNSKPELKITVPFSGQMTDHLARPASFVASLHGQCTMCSIIINRTYDNAYTAKACSLSVMIAVRG